MFVLARPMGRIALLSEELINKIAAGEVVERPASVVKELCENSIDAGARAIRVTLREGGLGAVSILDDGHGMSRLDAVLSLSRHATSKLRDAEGLFELTTKGFRGEALPAIAAVSRFTLVTSEPGAASGTRLHVEGGGPAQVEDAAPLGGTRIDVEDLFFNTPARRKFMRREQTELSHCEEAVIRLALAHPEIGFFLEHGGRMLLSSPACEEDPRERIAAALGGEIHRHLLPVDERRLGIRVHGFVASPEFTLPNARGFYAFVNRRYVRDRGLNHAIQRAFQDSLPPGRQPAVVLFIELDPRSVDVNVHPQKLEVRFADARGVYDALFGALTRALKTSPWLVPADVPQAAEPVSGAHYAHAVEQFLSRAQGATPFALPLPEPSVPPAGPSGGPTTPGFGQARPGLNEAPPPGYFSSLRHLGALGKRFLVFEGSGGTLVVIDPHAALERVRLHQLARELARADGNRGQGFLFSAQVELSVPDAKRALALSPSLLRLGIELEPFGGSTFALQAVPGPLVGADYRKLLSELLDVLPPPSSPGDPATYGPALRVLACHAAGQLRRAMGEDELAALLRELDGADFQLAAIHGRVVVLEIPFLELEQCTRSNLPK